MQSVTEFAGIEVSQQIHELEASTMSITGICGAA